MDADNRMSVAFFGVRGSRPVPDARFLAFGGNSSCVGVSAGGARLVLDAGSGIANVPRAYWASGATHVFLSHLHHDHIAGLMFYGALYEAGCKVFVYVPAAVGDGSLESYWRAPYFPVPLGQTLADVRVVKVEEGAPTEVGDGVPASGRKTVGDRLVVEGRILGERVHPNSGVAVYRVSDGRRSLVYATDVELADDASKAAVAGFAQGADLLILDAHFTDEEYRSCAGWGHNSVGMALEVAEMARCGRVVLFHHHPLRDDARMAALEEDAVRRHPRARAAREGDLIVL